MELRPVEEVIVPFPAPRRRLPPTSHFRSTWLASSLHALRERGLWDRYVEALDPAHTETITSAVAGVWLPIATAMAHYEACESLGLTTRDQIELGRRVMRHTHRTVFAVTMRLAARTMEPWTILGQANRIWDRNWVGGGIAVSKTGRREARVEVAAFPCARHSYCRGGMRGILIGAAELFCDKAVCEELTSLYTTTSMAFRLAWV